MNLTDIKGIGEVTADKLRAAGIDSVEQLANVIDLSQATITINPDWVEQAKFMIEQAFTNSSVTQSPKEITFTLLSGAHKGKVVHWNVGTYSLVIGRNGSYVSLATISVSEIDRTGNKTKFKFIWGNTISGAELDTAEYQLLAEESGKYIKPSYTTSMSTSRNTLTRAVQGVKKVASTVFGGCTSCGKGR